MSGLRERHKTMTYNISYFNHLIGY